MGIKYKEIKTLEEFIDAIRLRVNTFIIEQGFPAGWEPDEEDKNSKQVIAIINNKIVATARYREEPKNEIKIERLAVNKKYRKKNIGKGLLTYMIKRVEKLKPKRIWATVQFRLKRFYEKCGFKVISKPYKLWGVKHINVEFSIKK